MKRKTCFLALFVLILAAGLSASGDPPRVLERSFAAQKSIRLELVSGDCVIRTGAANKIEVRLETTFRPSPTNRSSSRRRVRWCCGRNSPGMATVTPAGR